MTGAGRPGRWAPWLVLGAFLAVVGAFAPRCGLHYDDYPYALTFSTASAAEVWAAFLRFVPGRNLQVPVFAALYRLAGGSDVLLHSAALALDAAGCLLAYFVLLRLTGLATVAFPAALFFAFMPMHGETHFWLTQTVQTCGSVFFLLLGLLIASGRPSVAAAPGRRVALALLACAPGMFLYDQVYALWPLVLAAAWFRAMDPPAAEGAAKGAAKGAAGINAFVVAGAAAMGLLAAGHALLRWVAPASVGAGGRPAARLDAVMERAREALLAQVQGTVPVAGLAAPERGWDWVLLAAAVAGGLAAGWFFTKLARSEKDRLAAYLESPGPMRLALFGAAWVMLAYGPNLFWYLSPRHHYIPSFGWGILCAAAGGWLVGRSKGLGRWAWLPVAVFVCLAVRAGALEGRDWAAAGRLQRGFVAAAMEIEAPRSLFLAGGPRNVGKALGFISQQDVTFAAAWRARRGAGGKFGPALEGDNHLTPTLAGAFYFNDLSIRGRHSFRWLPFSRVHAVAYEPATGFQCLAGLRLRLPDGRVLEQALAPAARCQARLGMAVDVAVIAMETAPFAAKSSSQPVPGVSGLGLSGASVTTHGERADFRFDWVLEPSAEAGFAVVPVLTSEEGRLLYAPAYPSEGLTPPVPLLWPFFNEVRPVLPARRRAVRVSETYAVRLLNVLPEGPCRMQLEFYRVRPGAPAERLGGLAGPAFVVSSI